jgi:hypothetical protein
MPRTRENLRIYFTQLPERSISTLWLKDGNTNESIRINFRISSKLALPQLDICFILRGTLWKSISGVYLGVHHRQGRLVQLYYICPVQGTIVGVDTINNSKEDESMDESDQEEHLDN